MNDTFDTCDYIHYTFKTSDAFTTNDTFDTSQTSDTWESSYASDLWCSVIETLTLLNFSPPHYPSLTWLLT